MDIARDPRWGRIAESLGEDPYLASVLAAAMVQGYQGKLLAAPGSIAACAKHYVGYGAVEAGREYNSTWIPENLLRDVYLKPFEAAHEAGVASYMTAFNSINGVPASANRFTLRQVLRNEWNFSGLVVSDYTAIHELIEHGYAADAADAAKKAIEAGVDMEMVSTDFHDHVKAFIDGGPARCRADRCRRAEHPSPQDPSGTLRHGDAGAGSTGGKRAAVRVPTARRRPQAGRGKSRLAQE